MAKNLLAVRAFHAFAFLGVVALLPLPAFAADEITWIVAPIALLLGAAAIAGSLYYRLANRAGLLEAERARLAVLVADRDALGFHCRILSVEKIECINTLAGQSKKRCAANPYRDHRRIDAEDN